MGTYYLRPRITETTEITDPRGEPSRSNFWKRTVAALLFCSFISIQAPLCQAEKVAAAASAKASVAKLRDPRQHTVFVTDFDGTFALNVGYYVLKRVFQLETPFFQKISGLPEEILVPVQDYEGNVGPRIKHRLGKRDERGYFTPSTSQDPIQLSNGEVIYPAFYYLDPETSYRQFRTEGDPRKGYLVKAIQEKLKKKTPFLLESFPFFVIAQSKAFSNRVQGVYLTIRGHDPAEMKLATNAIPKALKLPGANWPEPAYVNLGHPQFSEFSWSKVKYIDQLYHDLANRMMSNHSTPHYLVVFENDRRHLRDLHNLLENLSHQGIWANPVVPILVNLVEPEVFAHPDGIDWDDSPLRVVTKMSRVTIYWPTGVERTNDLSRVINLSLGVTPKEAQDLLATNSKSAFLCRRSLLGRNET